MQVLFLFKKANQYLRKEGLFTFFCRLIKFLFAHSILLKDQLSTKIIRSRLKSQYIIKEILGSRMELDLKEDTGISYELFKTGIREPYITKALQEEIKPGDVILDIGANIGYYALLEARLVGEKGKVYAIEPVPNNMELLRRNIKLNDYSNIETFQLAIGSENKVDSIYISRKCNWSSMLKSKRNDSDIIKKIPVQVITLDNFLEDKLSPDLIRMDVEGYETEIIKGMKELLSSGKPLKLLIEVHFHLIEDKTKIRNFLLALKNSGFRIKTATHEPDPAILGGSKFVRRIISALMAKTDFPFGYLDFSIGDLLQDELLLEGRRPCLEILFERE